MTLALLATMFTIGSIRYPGFATGQVVLNVFIDNSFLLIVSIGMTFVILTGGIDLSVGAVVALSTLMLALLVKHGWPTLLAILVVLVIGSTLGWTMGAVIHYFEIQPFIVTLAGMFLARGLCYAITVDAVSITKPRFVAIAEHAFNLPGDMYVTTAVVDSFVTPHRNVCIALHEARPQRLCGRRQRAIRCPDGPPAEEISRCTRSAGSARRSAGCSLVLHAVRLRQPRRRDGAGCDRRGRDRRDDLTGGVGYLAGSVLGVLALGLIQADQFPGDAELLLTRIVIGLLLFAFHPPTATRLPPQKELAPNIPLTQADSPPLLFEHCGRTANAIRLPSSG